MVIPEAREQIKQQQEKIRQQEESFRKAKEQLAQVSPKVTLTQSELLKQTPQTMVGVQAEEFRRQLEKTKVGEKLTQQEQEYQKQIEPYKQQLAAREEAIKGYESQLAAHQKLEEARKTGRVSNLALYGTGLAKELAQEYMKKRSWQTREYQKQYDEYEQQVQEYKQQVAEGMAAGTIPMKDVYFTPESPLGFEVHPITLAEKWKEGIIKTIPIQTQTTTQTTIPTTEIRGITRPSAAIYPSPVIISKDLDERYSGLYKGGKVYLPEDYKKSTYYHELGHYYAPPSLLKQATPDELKRISTEGRIVLGLKYLDFWGGMKEYTPEQYSQEALAVAQSWFMQGGIRRKMVETFMPSTIKFIEKEADKKLETTIPSYEVPEKFDIKTLVGVGGISAGKLWTAGKDISGKIREFIQETKPKPDVELSPELFAQQEALAQQYAMGEKFTLRYPTRYLGRQISKKIGDITGKTEAEIEAAFRQTPFFVSPFTEKKITMGQLEPAIKLLEPIAQTVLLFQLFSPAFMKGEYGESDYIYDYTKKKWVRKSQSQVLEFAERKTPTKADIKTLEDNLRNAYLQGDIQHIREAYRTALNTGNKDLIKSSETLLRNALGKETAGTIIKDIKAQEVIPAIKDITKPSIDLLSPKVADLPLTPEIAAASIWTGTGLYERTITPEEEFLKSKEQFIIEPVAPKSRFTEMTGLFVSPRIAAALKQPLRFKQPVRTREALRRGLGLGVTTALGLGLGLRTGQILKTRQIQKPVSPTITIGTLKIPTIKIPKFLIPSIKKKKKKKLKKEKAFEFEFVIPYGRRYGKFRPIGKPTTIKKAKAKGISFLRRTLGATIELRKAKTGEKIKVGAIGKGFRLGKKGKDPFQLVQRKTFRLGTRAERVALVRARRRGFKFI